jgi:hypothetical protein
MEWAGCSEGRLIVQQQIVVFLVVSNLLPYILTQEEAS